MKYICSAPVPRAARFLRLAALLVARFVFSMVTFAQATAGSLVGKITDRASSRPLAGALVGIVGTSLETSTDGEGDYYFSRRAGGTADRACFISQTAFEQRDDERGGEWSIDV